MCIKTSNPPSTCITTDKSPATMKGLCVLVFCLTLAIVVHTQGIPGGLGPQEFAGPGEQALVQQVGGSIPFGPFMQGLKHF